MSKSYSRYKTSGICCGSNTNYYRWRRRLFRVRSKRAINKALHDGVEEFDDNYLEYKQVRKDHWREPTDGSYKMYPNDITSMLSRPIHKGRHYGLYITKNNKVKK